MKTEKFLVVSKSNDSNQITLMADSPEGFGLMEAGKIYQISVAEEEQADAEPAGAKEGTDPINETSDQKSE